MQSPCHHHHFYWPNSGPSESGKSFKPFLNGRTPMKLAVQQHQQQQLRRRKWRHHHTLLPISAGATDVSGDSNHRPSMAEVLEGAKTYSLEKQLLERISLTGGAFDFTGATKSLLGRSLGEVKKIVLVRHGLSSWNAESRIQGSSDLSTLSEEGMLQAIKCKKALAQIKFDQCFASPILRAKSSAENLWEGREEPLIFLDTLREAHLHFLEGMRNEDAKREYPDVYRAWREDPANFSVDGVYPIVELWGRAKQAWEEIVSAEGQCSLVVTHKSILRALICTALGMGPDKFRAIDVNNGGISTFIVNVKGQPLLQNLNMTAHLHVDNVFY